MGTKKPPYGGYSQGHQIDHLVPPPGLEPGTLGLKIPYSNQLS
ncbi:protein of unknown function [Oenococcus oeni]|uniref:Uncharacterized protein n=1 Tax=Oenococcus oeni TaxID=1247 RepID=A0AAQ2UTC8_OENOE|nr:hypothetical protein OENI_170015 [Oenococcus oeni]SYW13159.1 hypothetical protein OENI_110001 [Oenococcus oeni]VDB97718.1 protein of unknown function [Oenococcus oeni]